MNFMVFTTSRNSDFFNKKKYNHFHLVWHLEIMPSEVSVYFLKYKKNACNV